MPWPQRLIAALPDAVTAGFFLTVWLAPMVPGEAAVANSMLAMLVEFIIVYSTGIMAVFVLTGTIPKNKRLLGIAGFTLFYLVFIAAFALAFGEWWPFLAFGWLLLGKFAVVLSRKAPSTEQSRRMMTHWGLAVVFYILGVLVTSVLPIPRLGITEDVQSQLALQGSGLWVDEPQRVIAFGMLYFALMAWCKWRDWLLPSGVTLAPAGKKS